MSGQPGAWQMGPGDGPVVRTGAEFIDNLRADLGEYVAQSPIQRAKAGFEAQEAAEERQAEIRRYNRAAEAEAQMIQRQQLDRVEILQHGRTLREVEAERVEAEQRRQHRIGELQAELGRLAPDRVSRSAEYGSEHNPARFVQLQDGSVTRLEPRRGQLSAREIADAPGESYSEREGRAFMARMISENDARRAARGPDPNSVEEIVARHRVWLAAKRERESRESGTRWPPEAEHGHGTISR